MSNQDEIIEGGLADGQRIKALVSLSVDEMLEKPRQTLADTLALYALGKDALGQFILDEFCIDPVGMVRKEVVFEVTGIARKVEKPIKVSKKPTKPGKEKK